MEIEKKKTSVHALRPTSSCISFVGHHNMSFHCHEMSLQQFFTVNSPVIFLKCTFEFVFNTARSASKGLCRWNCHGKGLKLKTFHQTYAIILSSVVVRRSHVKLKMPTSNPSQHPFFLSFFLFCLLICFVFFFNIYVVVQFYPWFKFYFLLF